MVRQCRAKERPELIDLCRQRGPCLLVRRVYARRALAKEWPTPYQVCRHRRPQAEEDRREIIFFTASPHGYLWPLPTSICQIDNL